MTDVLGDVIARTMDKRDPALPSPLAGRPSRPIRCPVCAYDLAGLPRPTSGPVRCPECGEPAVGVSYQPPDVAVWLGAFVVLVLIGMPSPC